MDVIFETKEYLEVSEANVFFHSLTKEEQQAVISMLRGVQLGMQLAKEKRDENRIA